MSSLARLGRWVATLDPASVPEPARRAARYQLLDMVAAAHAAARSEETASLPAGLAAFAAPGHCTVLPTGRSAGPADAAFGNAAFSMGQDFDDIVWMGHTCHSAVFASLAVCEQERRSGADLVTAVVIANEIGGRIGASCFLGPLNGQMWTFVHLAAAAAATAHLLRLDPATTTHALGIALAQPNFALQPGFLAPTSKLLAAATPTAAGIQAAYFARAGMTGAPELLEDRRGFWARFSYLPLPSVLEDLGTFWTTETLAVKTFPGCHYFQTAGTALERILARRGPLLPEQVRAVRIATTKLGMEATRFAGEYASPRGPIRPVNVNFDLATTAAILLHAGRLTGAELHPRWLAEHSAELLRWREKITVGHDPALTARVVEGARAIPQGRRALSDLRLGKLPALARSYRREYRSTLLTASELAGYLRLAARRLGERGAPAPVPVGSAVPLPFPNRVTIELASGEREEAEVDLPVGSFSSPGLEAELRAKFLRETAPALGAGRAERAFAAGLAPEQLPLEELVRGFCPEPGRLSNGD